jgi:hypothetical protein
VAFEEELAAAPQVYSVFKDSMLLAYARRQIPQGHEGAIRKASGKEPIVIAQFAHGIVDCFDTKAAKHIAELAAKADDFDALIFALKLDGFDVIEGESKPDINRWKF